MQRYLGWFLALAAVSPLLVLGRDEGVSASVVQEKATSSCAANLRDAEQRHVSDMTKVSRIEPGSYLYVTRTSDRRVIVSTFVPDASGGFDHNQYTFDDGVHTFDQYYAPSLPSPDSAPMERLDRPLYLVQAEASIDGHYEFDLVLYRTQPDFSFRVERYTMNAEGKTDLRVSRSALPPFNKADRLTRGEQTAKAFGELLRVGKKYFGLTQQDLLSTFSRYPDLGNRSDAIDAYATLFGLTLIDRPLDYLVEIVENAIEADSYLPRASAVELLEGVLPSDEYTPMESTTAVVILVGAFNQLSQTPMAHRATQVRTALIDAIRQRQR